MTMAGAMRLAVESLDDGRESRIRADDTDKAYTKEMNFY